MLLRRVLAAALRRPRSSMTAASAVHPFDQMPTPKSLPIFGTTLSLMAQGSSPNLHRYIDKRHQQLGPIFKERLASITAVFVADADTMRAVFKQEGKYPKHILPESWVAYNRIYGYSRGLFFMDDEEWLHYRRILNKLLLRGDFTWLETSCECVSDKLIQTIHKSNSEEFANLEGVLYKWSLDIMIAVLLGAETYQKLSGQIEDEVRSLASTVYLVFQASAKLYLIPSAIASTLNIPLWSQFVKCVDGALSGAGALISRLIREIPPDSDGLLGKLLREDIAEDDVKRIIVDLVLAAGDTTAYAMQWMLYLLGRSKEVQRDLRANNEMARSVLRETLRLYPVAPFLTRILPEDANLCGYEVPKNTVIVLSIFTSGRDEKIYKNAEVFQPSRWDRENNMDYNVGMQKASLPFAMGARSCIGKKIAEIQLQMTMLKIVNNYDVETCNEEEVEPMVEMVLVPSQPIRLRFKPLP